MQDMTSCANLKEIVIPSGVEVLKSFYACSSLAHVELPYGMTELSYNAFSRCQQLEEVNIPETVTSIGASAFGNCMRLKEITFPDGVTFSDTEFLFQSCTSLKEITIPEGSTTTVGYGMFESCGSLRRIKLPSSITSIQSSAFSFCYNLEEIDFTDAIAVPTLEDPDVFYYLSPSPFFQIKVPAALEAQWKAATNWSTYAAYYIVGV